MTRGGTSRRHRPAVSTDVMQLHFIFTFRDYFGSEGGRRRDEVLLRPDSNTKQVLLMLSKCCPQQREKILSKKNPKKIKAYDFV